MHVIAAKAVCFKEALQPEFKLYQTQVVANAEALATGLTNNGFRLVSGGTDNHLMLVDVGSRDMTGKECQTALDEAVEEAEMKEEQPDPSSMDTPRGDASGDA